MIRLFDSHCHLQDEAFGGDAAAAIARAREAGVAGMLVAGYNAPSNLVALEMAAMPAVYAAVGFHPHEAGEVTPVMLEMLALQASRDDVVCVGEIGLDFYRDLAPRQRQYEVLEAQLAIARQVRKPVSVHSRGAEEQILEPLARYHRSGRGAPGVMHCFGGTLEQALRFVEEGFSISLACTVTYPKNHEARRIAAELPLERLLIETDSPYLPPQSHRGRRNEPAFVKAAAEAIATVRSISVEEVAAVTTANAEQIFGIRVAAPAEAVAS